MVSYRVLDAGAAAGLLVTATATLPTARGGACRVGGTGATLVEGLALAFLAADFFGAGAGFGVAALTGAAFLAAGFFATTCFAALAGALAADFFATGLAGAAFFTAAFFTGAFLTGVFFTTALAGAAFFATFLAATFFTAGALAAFFGTALPAAGFFTAAFFAAAFFTAAFFGAAFAAFFAAGLATLAAFLTVFFTATFGDPSWEVGASPFARGRPPYRRRERGIQRFAAAGAATIDVSGHRGRSCERPVAGATLPSLGRESGVLYPARTIPATAARRALESRRRPLDRSRP